MSDDLKIADDNTVLSQFFFLSLVSKVSATMNSVEIGFD